MKWLVHFSFIGLFLVSCTEISYKEPQPKGKKILSQIPGKLHGKYLLYEDGEPVDTLIVFNSGYKIGKDEVASLSDSIVLKYYKGYYFLNMRTDFAWYLRVIKQQKNGDMVYLEMEGVPANEEDEKKFIEKLSAETPVAQTVSDDKTYYVIDPSPKKLVELIQKGFFKEQTFTRIK